MLLSVLLRQEELPDRCQSSTPLSHSQNKITQAQPLLIFSPNINSQAQLPQPNTNLILTQPNPLSTRPISLSPSSSPSPRDPPANEETQQIISQSPRAEALKKQSLPRALSLARSSLCPASPPRELLFSHPTQTFFFLLLLRVNSVPEGTDVISCKRQQPHVLLPSPFILLERDATTETHTLSSRSAKRRSRPCQTQCLPCGV